jgi:hypothetical protein
MFRGTHWIRSWVVLSKEEGRIILKEGCRWVEIVALEISHKSGWNDLRCIGISFVMFEISHKSGWNLVL